MNTYNNVRKMRVLSFWVGIGCVLLIGVSPAVFGQGSTDQDMQMLTRGPIHEAFANVSVNEYQAGIFVSMDVPEPIPEIPPDLRPEGDNVEWISGYWSWDEEQDDYIWVSGVWRDIPPYRQWVPGYWTQAEGGNMYVSGFWAEADQTEMVYLPPPPETREQGPSSPQVGSNQIWTQGTWVWYENQYQWRPGYWAQDIPEYIWVPSHYVWTPMGYVFVMGYWDHQLVHRGVLFAPVYYTRHSYTRPGYYYTPSITLDINSLYFALFIRMQSHHYYFGDYYDSQYLGRGYHPWYSAHATRYGYDPYYRNYRSRQMHHDREWENRLHRQYEYRRDHREARPPHTYAQQANFNHRQSANTSNIPIGRRFADVVTDRKQPIQFTRLNQNKQKEFQTRNRKLNTFQAKRKELENPSSFKGKLLKHTEITKPLKKQMAVSPIRSESGKKLQKGNPANPGKKPEVLSKDQPRKKPKGKPQGKPHMDHKNQPQGKNKDEKPEIKPDETPVPALDMNKNEEKLSK